MNEIKVSVIIPAFNVEDYISDCLNSLVKQTLQEIEVIVVNDGSTDHTPEIIKQYALKHPGKIVFIDSENAGSGLARNKAMDVAKGKYIGFVGSDDWVEADMYHTLYSEAEKGYDVVVCGNRRKKFVDSTGFWASNPFIGKLPLSV